MRFDLYCSASFEPVDLPYADGTDDYEGGVIIGTPGLS